MSWPIVWRRQRGGRLPGTTTEGENLEKEGVDLVRVGGVLQE